MPSLDIFNTDPFGLVQMTKAINDGPHIPHRIGELGLFAEDGVATTSVMIERQGTGLALVQSAPRGSSGAVVSNDKRKLLSLPSIHLPQRGGVNADEVQNVRAFGSETDAELVQTVVNKQLAKLRRNLDVTMEWQRMGAIKGLVLDADGSTLLDLFAIFGFTKQTKDMALDVDATKVRSEVVAVKRMIEAKLGAKMYRGIRVLCGPDFFDAFVDHPSVVRAYDNFQDRAKLAEDLRAGFPFAGAVWEEYRGKVGATDFIAADKAYAIPEGVADMFCTHFAPADYMETVNTLGLPYYAKQELRDFNKGVDIEAQSNPITYCTQPDAVIELSI
jgi:hypothetical protein